MDALERIRRLREEYESVLDEADRLRAKYHREIVKLHRSGVSLREIAEGLGVSHQRVHQIVSPSEGGRRSRRKAAAVAGVVSSLLVLGFAGAYLGGGLTAPDRPVVRPTASPHPELSSPLEITFGCSLSPPDGSTFTTIAIAAVCQQQIDRLLRHRDRVNAIVLEPETGRLIAVVSNGVQLPHLEGALAPS